MDQPINGDKYVRTLSHYFRHNQKRLVPTDPSFSNKNEKKKSNSSPVVRSIITPSDPMAYAYTGMVNSLWSVGTAVVDVVSTPFGADRQQGQGQIHRPIASSLAQDRDAFSGAWDGTGTIQPDSPRERQLYLQAQLKAPIFPLDLYYLLYLLDRFELEGIDVEGWDGSTPRAVGDSKPRILNNSNNVHNSTYSSFPPPTTARPQSIRSFSSTALSTLTLITGWKQWSNAANSTSNNTTVTDDVHFIRGFLKKLTGLRLVSKIPPGLEVPVKGRIDGYSGHGILNILAVPRENNSNYSNYDDYNNYDNSSDQQEQPFHLILPLAATFSSLTHLEIHKIPPRSIDGWEALMPQMKSLVIIQSGIEDVYEAVVTAVVESERRRRQRVSREKNRAVLIRQEQREALKEAAMAGRNRRLGGGSATSSSSSNSPESSQASSPSLSQSGGSLLGDYVEEDDQTILDSIKMWPVLRHLSVSDNSLPQLPRNETFNYTPAVVTLDLSHNLLVSPPEALIHLHNLHTLNLSYNMITTVQAIYQTLGNIAVLDLRGNRLESLCGLERLWNLEKVDVRENSLDEAAEVGRLAALPCIREVWSEMNPFCTQTDSRLEILAVFKANGHELLLDGTFASFNEKFRLSKLSPSSFSTTLASINVINPDNIPAPSAPAATLAKELSSPPPRITRPTSTFNSGADSVNVEKNPPTSTSSATTTTATTTTATTLNRDSALTATSPSGTPQKLVKKKLVKSSKRAKRIVNLDSDHSDDHHSDYDGDHHSHHHHDYSDDAAYSKVLGPPAEIGKKKLVKKKPTVAADGTVEEKKPKKKVVKKKSHPVSFAQDHPPSITSSSSGHVDSNTNGSCLNNDGEITAADHIECKDNRHVHRLTQLERSMSNIHLNHNTANNNNNNSSSHQHQPSRSILKKSSDGLVDDSNHDSHYHPHHHHSTGIRPSSPFEYSSSDDGADGYRRKIEAMRNEAGTNWLKVLAEMDNNSESQQKQQERQTAFRNTGSIGA
ncbi:hypothetical protein BGZ76_000642 [Entomortierella beljakovae]|nr:hypothetical protein BGZ76_000642 [Entomortierella beljakovae]